MVRVWKEKQETLSERPDLEAPVSVLGAWEVGEWGGEVSKGLQIDPGLVHSWA